MSRWNFPSGTVYLVTDPGFVNEGTIVEQVLAAVEAGVSLVQLRDKHASTRSLVQMATLLVDTLAVPVIVNDRVDVALASGAAGVHLGQSDMPAHLARRLLGKGALIGLSIEALDELDDEKNIAAVDYLAASPVFETTTKADVAPALGLAGVSAIASRTGLPVVGIGGISADNIEQVFAAGAAGVAVVSAILGAADPTSATRELVWRAQPSTREAS